MQYNKYPLKYKIITHSTRQQTLRLVLLGEWKTTPNFVKTILLENISLQNAFG